MKGKKCHLHHLILLFLCLFCGLLLCLSTSTTVSAVELSLGDFDTVYTNVEPPYCRYNVSGTWSSWTPDGSPQIIHNSSSETYIKGWQCRSGNNNNISVLKGDVVVHYVRVIDNWPESALNLVYKIHQYSEISAYADITTGTDENNIVDIEAVAQVDNRTRRSIIYRITSVVLKNTINPDFGVQIRRNEAPSNEAAGSFNTVIRVIGNDVYRPKKELDYTTQLNEIKAAINSINMNVKLDELQAQEEATTDAVNNPDYIQQEKQDLEDAKEEAESSADDAGSEAEGATQSLLSTITSIIEAITSATPTNCNLNLNIPGRLNSGSLNLCNAPSEIRSVISIFVVIPLTLGVLHLAYSLINEYLDRIRKEQE